MTTNEFIKKICNYDCRWEVLEDSLKHYNHQTHTMIAIYNRENVYYLIHLMKKGVLINEIRVYQDDVDSYNELRKLFDKNKKARLDQQHIELNEFYNDFTTHIR